MLEHILGCFRAVFKGNVAKLDTAVRWRRSREVPRRIDDKGLFIEHLCDTAHARESACEQQKHVGNHHERVHDQQHVAHKARERAHAQATFDDHAAANPQNGKRRHVHRQLKHRQVEHSVAKGLGRRAGELGIDGVELVALVLSAHVSLHGAHGGKVLLHHAVEVVHRGLELAVERAHTHGNDTEHDGEHRQNDGKDRRELARERKSVDEAHDQIYRPAHHGAEAVTYGVLNHGDVGGHAGDKRAGVVVVQIAKSERLDLAILGLAQVSAQPRGDASRRACIAQAKYQRKCGAYQHIRTLQQHVVDVARGHAHIDDICHDDRDKQLERRLSSHKEHAEYGIAAVCPQIGKQNLEIAHAGSSPIKRCSQTHVLWRAVRRCQVFRNRFLQG